MTNSYAPEIGNAVYLECVNSMHKKYYCVFESGNGELTALYGRIGAAPQRAKYSILHWRKKLDEKAMKGYVRRTLPTYLENYIKSRLANAQGVPQQVDATLLASRWNQYIDKVCKVEDAPIKFHLDPSTETSLENTRAANDKLHHFKEKELSNAFGNGLPEVKVWRVVAMKDFTAGNGVPVKTGDLGGYVNNPFALSLYNGCWIFDDAVCCVSDKQALDAAAKIVGSDNAAQTLLRDTPAPIVSESGTVTGTSFVFGGALVDGSGQVTGNSFVFGEESSNSSSREAAGKSIVSENARVYGNAVVLNSTLHQNAMVGENAVLFKSEITEDAWVSGLATVSRRKIGGSTFIEN